ncbi:MAG TPA: hypothetical protein VFK97_01740, partial [Candidatus Saccharimonadales bacterium]|nr:hypothetical protein [Candidatus Saccharimonadales bacterium]
HTERIEDGLFEVTPADLDEAVLIGEACVTTIFDLVLHHSEDLNQRMIERVIIPLGGIAGHVMNESGPIKVDEDTLKNLQRALAFYSGARDPDTEATLTRILNHAGIDQDVLHRLSGRPKAWALSMNLGGFIVALGHDSTA